MNVKYPIELELSSFCSLKCISCINSSIKSKTNISIENFDLILDYVFKNKDNILYINLSWVWDIFLHPDIDKILIKFIKIFKNTNIDILISTKWTYIKPTTLKILSTFKENWVNLNICVWIFSMEKQKYENFTQTKGSFEKVLKFLFILKKNNFNFSLELLLSSYSLDSINLFKSLINKLKIDEVYYKYHNFNWRINLESEQNFHINLKQNCDFNEHEIHKNSFYKNYSNCKFIPFISSDLEMYLCSLSSHWKSFWDFKELIQKYPNFIDLVFYFKEQINLENCSKCSLYK